MAPGFDPEKPRSTDWPSIAAVAGGACPRRNNLPPAVVLPERLVHRSGRVIPGQFGGQMGLRRDPWFIEACRFNPNTYGAWPEYGFHFEHGAENPPGFVFQAPNLAFPEGLARRSFPASPGDLLSEVDRQRGQLERMAANESFDRYRQDAISLLSDSQVHRALDVVNADAKVLDRYGRNVFGWSLLMAKHLVASGVSLVQVNLGNNETWDTHQSMFPVLKDQLLPPTDRALSALLDDLSGRGVARQHPHRHGRRVRPHAENIHIARREAAGPRPLGCGANRLLRRWRGARRHRDRLFGSQWRPSG